MKKIIIFALCLFLLSCEQDEIDASKPKDLDEAVALFCKEANKEIPNGSHVIVRKKDFKSVNEASKEYIHWKILQNFTGRKNIKTYGNENVTPQDVKDVGAVFTIDVRLEKWEGVPFYRGFFSVEKNGVKAANESILLKDYAIKTEGILSTLLKKQNSEEPAELAPEGEEPLVEENGGIGFLKIVNENKEDNIIGVRIYKGNSLLINKDVNISHSGGKEEYKLESGEYTLKVKISFDDKICTVGKFKITDSKTVTKSYMECK
jgi:hypothetical protein